MNYIFLKIIILVIALCSFAQNFSFAYDNKKEVVREALESMKRHKLIVVNKTSSGRSRHKIKNLQTSEDFYFFTRSYLIRAKFGNIDPVKFTISNYKFLRKNKKQVRLENVFYFFDASNGLLFALGSNKSTAALVCENFSELGKTVKYISHTSINRAPLGLYFKRSDGAINYCDSRCDRNNLTPEDQELLNNGFMLENVICEF